MWMSYLLENGNFSIDTVNITLVLDLILLENFDGYFVSSYNVSSLFNFSKCTFTFCLSYNKPTNLLSLTVLLFFQLFFILFFFGFYLVSFVVIIVCGFRPSWLFLILLFLRHYLFLSLLKQNLIFFLSMIYQ